jgi:uncharacterized membrane protein
MEENYVIVLLLSAATAAFVAIGTLNLFLGLAAGTFTLALGRR